MSVEHGYIPLGKYSNARDDILHYLCTSEWSNDSFGNVDEYGAYVWKISNDPADVAQDNTEFSSLLAEWLENCPEVTDSPELRAELAGHFIVTTVSSGFVYVTAFDTEAARDAVYSEAETAWAEWNDDDDTSTEDEA